MNQPVQTSVLFAGCCVYTVALMVSTLQHFCTCLFRITFIHNLMFGARQTKQARTAKVEKHEKKCTLNVCQLIWIKKTYYSVGVLWFYFSSCVFWQLLGFVFLGLGLWLRFSGSTRGFFELQGSSAFVMGQYTCHSPQNMWRYLYVSGTYSIMDLSLSLFKFSCDCADSSRLGDADCGGVWRPRRLQWEKMFSASGETVLSLYTLTSL